VADGRVQPKPVYWIGPTLEVLRTFPDPIQDEVGFALFQAQLGGRHVAAKRLKGFGGVLEVVANDDGNTYRAVYTVRFAEAIYALHAFQKKSKQGVRTPKHEIDLVRARLRVAEEQHARRIAQHP
jgi:phage-related protein